MGNLNETYYDLFRHVKDKHVLIGNEKFRINPYCYESYCPIKLTCYNVNFVHENNKDCIDIKDLTIHEYKDVLKQIGLRGYWNEMGKFI